MRASHLLSVADLSVMLKNLPISLILAKDTVMLFLRWAHDNTKLIAATTHFIRICLVFPQLIVVPSAVSDRLLLLQKDFAALNTEMEVIIVLSSVRMDYQ